MTTEQLQKGLQLQEKIREFESRLIYLNDKANQETMVGEIRIGVHIVELDSDLAQMAIEIEKAKLAAAVKTLKTKLEML